MFDNMIIIIRKVSRRNARYVFFTHWNLPRVLISAAGEKDGCCSINDSIPNIHSFTLLTDENFK
jgi:hypothetical protein